MSHPTPDPRPFSPFGKGRAEQEQRRELLERARRGELDGIAVGGLIAAYIREHLLTSPLSPAEIANPEMMLPYYTAAVDALGLPCLDERFPPDFLPPRRA